MAKKAGNKKSQTTKTSRVSSQKGVTRQSFLDFFKLGESYTSLLLGIIVVVISTILLLSFAKSNKVNKVSQSNQQIAQNTQNVSKAPKQISPTVHLSPTVTIVPTVKVTFALTPTLTQVPTITKAIAQKTNQKKKTVTTNPVAKPVKGQTYTVAAGDNLWVIAEKEYKSGYNWVDIAKANNITDPGTIYKGSKLVIPSVEPKIATVTITAAPQTNTVITNRITGNTYTIVKGDSLWNIAVRAYGDGYKWVDIAKANNLDNPDIIHSGNMLKIPRNG